MHTCRLCRLASPYLRPPLRYGRRNLSPGRAFGPGGTDNARSRRWLLVAIGVGPTKMHRGPVAKPARLPPHRYSRGNLPRIGPGPSQPPPHRCRGSRRPGGSPGGTKGRRPEGEGLRCRKAAGRGFVPSPSMQVRVRSPLPACSKDPFLSPSMQVGTGSCFRAGNRVCFPDVPSVTLSQPSSRSPHQTPMRLDVPKLPNGHHQWTSRLGHTYTNKPEPP